MYEVQLNECHIMCAFLWKAIVCKDIFASMLIADVIGKIVKILMVILVLYIRL